MNTSCIQSWGGFVTEAVSLTRSRRLLRHETKNPRDHIPITSRSQLFSQVWPGVSDFLQFIGNVLSISYYSPNAKITDQTYITLASGTKTNEGCHLLLRVSAHQPLCLRCVASVPLRARIPPSLPCLPLRAGSRCLARRPWPHRARVAPGAPPSLPADQPAREPTIRDAPPKKVISTLWPALLHRLW